MYHLRLHLLFLLLSLSAVGQQIPIQFALTDTAGIELQNRTVDVKATLTSDTTSFSPEYQETQSVTTNDFGIASFWIGEGNTTMSSSNSSINTNWLNPNIDYFIVLQVDSTGFGYNDLATIRYQLPLVAVKSINADSSAYSQSADSSLFANQSDQAYTADTSLFANQSSQAYHAQTTDSSDFALRADTSIYSSASDSSFHSLVSDTSQLALIAEFSDTAGYSINIDPGAFSDSSTTNEIQSLEQVLAIDSNANNRSIYNVKSLIIGDTLISSSAALSVNSTNAGLLLPRLTKIQRDVIPNPEQGLVVYCTDCETEGRISVYDGSTWELLGQTNSTGSYAVISAGSIDNITVSGATFNGAVSDSGGTTVFAKGFCLSPNPYPSLADVVIGPDLLDSSGVFRGRADYLDRNSKYYVRAYATNAAGTVFGPQQEFLTEGVLAVGDTFGGGIVGYILQPGDNGYDPDEQHGIIVANQDYGTLVDWGSCDDNVKTNGAGGSYLVGRTSELLFDAYYNDSIWQTYCPDSLDQYVSYYSSLMHIVRDISWQGYDDWTVGSIGDYEKLFVNIVVLDSTLNQPINGRHWTSTSHNATAAYRKYFQYSYVAVTNSLTGAINYEWRLTKNETSFQQDYAIRPIRYF